MLLPLANLAGGLGHKIPGLRKFNVCIGLRASSKSGPSVSILAGQVLLYRIRKEAALDLHSPFSTSHSKPIRLADWPLASPLLTFPTLCLF
jgi:hypothetical protein